MALFRLYYTLVFRCQFKSKPTE